jgi:hypothetical protein
MSGRKRRSAKGRTAGKEQDIPQPVNRVDGIPDRSTRPALWKYLLLVAIFLAWVAFLIYCQLAGRVEGAS